MKSTGLRRRDRGFTLIEIAVVIVILALLLTMLLGISSTMIAQQRREATRTRLAAVETALALFVSQNQRLPCPADGRLVSSDVNAGLERGTAPAAATNQCNVIAATVDSQTHGVVPWRALGLSEPDITDGWGNRLTYRVAPEFVRIGSMNFTNCDPGGGANPRDALTANGYCSATVCVTASLANCIRPSTVIANGGLLVQNFAMSTNIMDPGAGTGAAYIVISHGENGAGAYNNQGVVQAAASASSATETGQNGASVAFVKAPNFVASTQVFVDDFPNYNVGASYFDDFILRPTLLTVATKAQLGPRAH